MRLDSQSAEFHYDLARAFLASNDVHQAIAAFQRAFERDPQGRLDRRECLDVFRFLQFQELPAFWYADLERFFRRGDVDRFRYAKAGLNALLAKAAFQRACAAPDAAAILAADLEAIMGDALFCLLLAETLIADARFEILLTRLRRRLVLDGDLRSRAPLDFLAGLAQQCFLNEHVYAESEEEAAALQALQGDEPRALAVFGMYRALSSRPDAGALEGRCEAAPGSVQQLVRRAVANVLQERRIAEALPSAGAIADPVSRQVRAQYEANPYPRWLSLNRPAPVSTAQWVAADAPGVQPEAIPAAASVLVAGCGTGAEALAIACGAGDAAVTAVDLSRASLAYGTRMASELGVATVRFLQADILALDVLERTFDVVYCTGVLHHMREPAAGLAALCRRMRPGGLLRLGLYTRRGRADVNAARALIRARGLQGTEAEIRAFRQEVLRAPNDSPMRGLLGSRDFYSLSECRDLLFHVQEHQFDLLALGAMIRGERLEILGLSRQMPASCALAYRRTFPGEATNGGSLDQWDEVESRFPEIFRGMVLVWCRRPETYNGGP